MGARAWVFLRPRPGELRSLAQSAVEDFFFRDGRLALTATATRVVVRDIIEELGMVEPLRVRGSFFRRNLRLAAQRTDAGHNSRCALLAYVRHYRGAPGIVYTGTRRAVEGLTAFVQAPGVRAVARTFAVSILIPKATVATTTVAVPRAKASCCAEDGDVRAGRANRVSLAAPGPLLR